MSHRSFVDKKRREINLSKYEVKSVLPEHFQEDYPKLVTFLEKYYEQLDSDSPVELLKHLYEKKDIIATDVDLLQYIEDELLLGQSYFQGFSNPRAASEFASTLYRAKGSKFSIEQFFRMFYNEDPDVVYGKDLIFKLNDSASEIGVTTDKRITNNKLYQIFAILIKIGLPVSDWESIYKLFVHPSGMYLEGLVQLVNEADLEVDNMPDVIPSPDEPIAVVGEGFAAVAGLGEQTEIFFGDSANDQYRLNLGDTISLYSTMTIQQIADQYSTLVEQVESNAPTFDEDHDADSSGVGLSNTFETIDQERYFWWDPDSADYQVQIIQRDDSAD
jgi:hypothetical protein